MPAVGPRRGMGEGQPLITCGETHALLRARQRQGKPVAGGVAANAAIKKELILVSKKMKFIPLFPKLEFCGDNAAMIAWAGIKRFKKNLINDLEFKAKSRWPLDLNAPFMKGPGLKI